VPDAWVHCFPKLQQCLDQNFGEYDDLAFEALLEKIRRTSAGDICHDYQEYETCQRAVLSESPCDQLFDPRVTTHYERLSEAVEHFCGPELDNFEENKNCFANQRFIDGAELCHQTYLWHRRNCSEEAFLSCVEALTQDQADCGPGAIPFLHDVFEALIYVEDAPNGQLCRSPENGNFAKNFLKQFLKRF